MRNFDISPSSRSHAGKSLLSKYREEMTRRKANARDYQAQEEIQELIELESRHGMLKLTTGTYWRPSEKDINRGKGDDEDDDWGVKPDKGYEVAIKKDSGNGGESKPPDGGGSNAHKEPDADPQFEKALEYIHSTLEDAKTT